MSITYKECLGTSEDVPERLKGSCLETTCELEPGKPVCRTLGRESQVREIRQELERRAQREAARSAVEEESLAKACSTGRAASCKGWYDRALATEDPVLALALARRTGRKRPLSSEILTRICAMDAWRCQFHDEKTDTQDEFDRMTDLRDGSLVQESARKGVLRKTEISPSVTQG
jgi:hypothetical protein